MRYIYTIMYNEGMPNAPARNVLQGDDESRLYHDIELIVDALGGIELIPPHFIQQSEMTVHQFIDYLRAKFRVTMVSANIMTRREAPYEQ